ncbi:jasmonate ZIM domain-containing protein 1 [Cicer arietinum]|uniref:Protein TIFY n=1 Tax=Cicer arietinum TaxID=3827 RepID=A0A1S2YVC6_CICAR|nr:protein TIFY 11B [Cicer arietinum]
MSTFPNTVSDSQRSGKAPEKFKFSQTCSLLSQFLKEKRISGDSTPGLFGKIKPKASTKDLLGNKQNSDGGLRLNASAMDSLPQLVENPCIKKSNIRSTNSETPQLTIFYAGKMLVFDAFRPEKATEIMELATKLASENSSREENPTSAPITSEKLKDSKVPQPKTALETPRENQVIGSDMRYPRRASLLKFLEKRKERVISRGPYQINNHKIEGSSSGGEPKEQCSKHFDLNI